MTNFKIIFVHGYTASHLADWYPKITPLLKNDGVDFVVPDLPGHQRPHSDKWLEIIDKEYKKSVKPVVFVGHSLGTRAILLYLDQYKKLARSVILIAPLSNELANANRRDGEAYPDFFEYVINLNKVKEQSNSWLILHSKDDHSLDYESHGLALSKSMGIELLTYEDRDHFSKPENAHIIYSVLKKRLSF